MVAALLSTSAKAFKVMLATSVAVGTALAPLGGALSHVFPITVQSAPQEELSALIADLQSPMAHDRAMAACRIGKIRGGSVAAAREPLLALLGDGEAVEGELCRDWGNWRGRGREKSSPGREAAIALEQLGDPVVEPLTDILTGGGEVARGNAALALGLIESSRAVGPLSRALHDVAEPVRSRAAWALGMIEDAAAVDPLAAAFGDPSPEVRGQVAWALGMIEASSAVPALARALQDDVAEVRKEAAWALGMIEDADAVDGLVRALRDDNAEVREQAAWALGMIESSAAVEGLVTALADPEADVREQAAWALGMIEDAGAVDGLMNAIEDEDPGVRKQALWALMRCVEGDDDLDYAELQRKLRKALLGGGLGA